MMHMTVSATATVNFPTTLGLRLESPKSIPANVTCKLKVVPANSGINSEFPAPNSGTESHHNAYNVHPFGGISIAFTRKYRLEKKLLENLIGHTHSRS